MEDDMRRNEIVTKLLTMEKSLDNQTWKAWIRQTIDFIRGQE
jgi:hypothetical protein